MDDESPERTLLKAIYSSTTNSNHEEMNKKALEFIEHVTAKADEVQRHVLRDILSKNAQVEYLRRHGLGGATDRETFKRVMPIITYEDIKSDINRIVDGDTTVPIFCSDPVLEFTTRKGSLNPRITYPSVREAVSRILKPDPKLADFVEAECSKESWQGIIIKLWPNAKYVDAIVTGSLSQYIPSLEYYADGLPLASTLFGSSETNFGVILNPLCKPTEVSYTFIPTFAYFEFLSLHNDYNKEQHRDLVDLVDVKLGQEYEVVVTTYAGLYRYRIGDMVRVAGFKNNAPQFNVIGRKNVVLSIESDKTEEIDLQHAINNAINHLEPFGATLSEYTSFSDTLTVPGHYVLFWELGGNGSNPIPPSVFEECCITIEESLGSEYRLGRASYKSIGPLEIKIVEAGTFEKVMDYAIKNTGSSMGQYKTPKSVKLGPIVELLNSRVVKIFTSPKCPMWTPGHKQWSNKA